MPARKKNRRSHDVEVLYGFHPVEEAIRAGRRKIYEIYLLKTLAPERAQRIAALSESCRIPVRWLEAADIQRIVGTGRHQGVGARAGAYPWVDISRLLDRAQAGCSPAFFLVLDGVVDPQNLGALVRTAVCTGVDGICIPKDRSARPTPAVSRASAGALEHVEMAQITNVSAALSVLKKAGCWIVGLDASAKDSIFSLDLTVSAAFVIGGEEKGLRPLVKKQCDHLAAIPQSGKVDSLNASAAGAVSMYELFRQRLLRNP